VAFVSLGCAKNLVDSEKMLGLLAEAKAPLEKSVAEEITAARDRELLDMEQRSLEP